MSLFAELKRRNVFRVGAAHVVAAWLIIQVAETIFLIYGLSNSSIRIVITTLAIGLIPAVIFAWAFEDLDVFGFVLPIHIQGGARKPEIGECAESMQASLILAIETVIRRRIRCADLPRPWLP